MGIELLQIWCMHHCTQWPLYALTKSTRGSKKGAQGRDPRLSLEEAFSDPAIVEKLSNIIKTANTDLVDNVSSLRTEVTSLRAALTDRDAQIAVLQSDVQHLKDAHDTAGTAYASMGSRKHRRIPRKRLLTLPMISSESNPHWRWISAWATASQLAEMHPKWSQANHCEVCRQSWSGLCAQDPKEPEGLQRRQDIEALCNRINGNLEKIQEWFVLTSYHWML